MPASLMIDLAVMVAAAAAPQAQDCRTIADPAARLTCYDSREGRSRDAAPAATPPAAPVYAPPASAPAYTPPASAPATVAASAPRPSSASAASIIRADPTGRVVSVTPLRYGLFRLTLDDGRAYDTTTNLEAPPAVGASVRLRRTPVLGTTFLDVPGRTPLTVRLVRR